GRWKKILLITVISLLLLYYFLFAFPFRGMFFNQQRHGNPPLTPAWALECWLWEDDVNTAAYVDTLLNGYAKYDIPVRTILIDSPWSLRYNDYEIDTLLYPQPKIWFGQLQDKGYRVVLWITKMVNIHSNDTKIKESESFFREASGKGYLAGSGEINSWWKGKGGFIDYTNPEAMKWWRGRQQNVFDLGIDGWKLDGTATLFYTKVGPVPFLYKKTKSGLMTTRTYMDHYYRDEYRHGLTQNPEFVTLARSIDRWYHPEGFAPLDAAPVTWVGDQKHTWESTGQVTAEDKQNKDIALDGIDGIEMAIQNILEAAELRYNIIGSDVAGFSGRNIPPRLYIRWAQFSAFCGLFLNGGHGDRALWHRTPQELEVIRRFSWLHTELVPYMYSYVVTGHQGGRVLQKPVEGKYHYLFGEDFLVAPIYRDNLKNSVTLPAGKWRYFFDDKVLIESDKPVTFEREYPLEEFPVYIREGAIVPLNVERSYTGLGSEANKGSLTWLIYPGVNNHFTVHHPDKSGSSTVSMENFSDRIELSLKEMKKSSVFSIHLEQKPSGLSFNGIELNDSTDYQYDEKKLKLTAIKPDVSDGVLIIRK
ncbi:MAG TPA: TIM-barrel domain-containing protein, partial [Prolixibacteraceae bacterium]|nr:TIM-barrel domain-containing protein [Prolixibacteraceae bacterium]